MNARGSALNQDVGAPGARAGFPLSRVCCVKVLGPTLVVYDLNGLAHRPDGSSNWSNDIRASGAVCSARNGYRSIICNGFRKTFEEGNVRTLPRANCCATAVA